MGWAYFKVSEQIDTISCCLKSWTKFQIEAFVKFERWEVSKVKHEQIFIASLLIESWSEDRYLFGSVKYVRMNLWDEFEDIVI